MYRNRMHTVGPNVIVGQKRKKKKKKMKYVQKIWMQGNAAER